MDGLRHVGDVAGAVLQRDVLLNSVAVRLLHIMPPLEHGKAVRELGWVPGPTPDAIREADRFYVDRTDRRRR